jgi:hypothetical protein
MFIVALFIIASLWKWPRCPTNDEWIKKIWHVYTMDFIQPQRRKKFCCFRLMDETEEHHVK